ncbi:efflux RND transporter periplasmic adaptor subunit [Chitinophaga nivalis]|uniref:Efflux RND transporter periplasmic adaptor subunit n=1 Tax=Chitinophaga nivalis TaxID=2991709 RepID=A0ABT3IPS5_9BACT|nr:efflux RND transporter periplasmic adaptor subunit [Chitinophaga nivalis]MCW3464376.1 efflux RND transporter periplasmic adaptor subunit [Chitinophaga nivalis]MCW3485933.1 efflux RND transporter periplasmic adaptor subunit [Chitinophaga nivalis]
MKPLKPIIANLPAGLLYSFIVLTVMSGCGTSQAKEEAPQAAQLPVLKVSTIPATTYREYSATLEGRTNVEIRAQVEGILEKIYVDEGAYVKAGEPLFRINDRVYKELQSNANGSLQAAKANLEKAQLEVDRLTPLVSNNVVSEVQLKTAQAAYQAAKAAVSQAQAQLGNASINVGYTIITAPVSGYIGRIPYKAGALVGRAEPQPLTLLSDVSQVYAYFSMSEPDFLKFKNETAGNSIAEKVKQLPAVELKLADNSIYTEKGKIETMEGQFDKTMGAVSFRASFPNAAGLLRSGNTGKIRIPEQFSQAVVIPAEATYEMQDKVMVFLVSDSNKVVGTPITIAGKSGNYYFVDKGVKAGQSIVYAGLDRLHDGTVVAPQHVSLDSLLKVRPL